VALLELQEDVKDSKCVGSITMSAEPLEADKKVEITGWGGMDESAEKNILQKASFNILRRDDCLEKYQAFRSSDEGSWLADDIDDDLDGNSTNLELISSTMLCASGEINQKTGKTPDACDGDFGGPITLDEQLVGVVSWGACSKSGNNTVPLVFEQVSKHSAWIEKIKDGTTKPNEYCPDKTIKTLDPEKPCPADEDESPEDNNENEDETQGGDDVEDEQDEAN